MDEDTVERSISHMAMIMPALAAMETVQSIGETVNRSDGPRRFGASGD
ncbi:hypothetical protein [Rhizobium chutanense]|nr:hypothetical protein [Rhizobium chutanense]